MFFKYVYCGFYYMLFFVGFSFPLLINYLVGTKILTGLHDNITIYFFM